MKGVVHWDIVELPEIVEYCRPRENGSLRFHTSLDEALKLKPDVLLLSGVIGYVKDYRSVIRKVCETPYIILNRTAFWNGENRVVIQKVPPKFYTGSYPIRVFNEQSLLGEFKGYSVILEFPSEGGNKSRMDLRSEAYFKGFLLRHDS